MSPVSSIPRTATFAWSPSTANLLATGTVAGALDENFSNEAELELWNPFASLDELGQLAPRASIKTAARFNRLAWGYVNPADRPDGVIAAGMENGDLGLYDPAKMIASDTDGALVYKHTQHSGPVRGLDFNKLQPNLLASGATNGEIFIWDLTNPQKPYSPGSRSRNLDDITSLAWNKNVAHVLATSSSSGYTVVWDLKGKREVVALNFNAAANGMQGGPPAWMGQGMPTGRRGGINAICWHPENPTKLVTASDDDLNPVIMLWDLRNSMAPERVLTGHEKGVLGLSWCGRDSELLLSSGKDCRNLCWNPTTGELVGELPASSNWVFQTEWCPRNPGMVATASLDGQINVNTLQSTLPHDDSLAAQPAGADIFESGNLNAQQRPTLSLKQTPRWLRRPVSAAFGFGGKLVTTREAPPSVPGAPHSSHVALRQVVTEHAIVERALRLDNAVDTGALAGFCETRASDGSAADADESTSWQLLRTLFRANSRDELVTLLGFSKDEVRTRVEDAIRALKPAGAEQRSLSRSASGMGLQPQRRASTTSESGSIAREPLVTFAESAQQRQDGLSGSSEGEAAGVNEGTPSETSGTVSEGTKLVSTEGAPTESEITEPSLFGDEPAGGQQTNPQQAAADFYSSIRSGRPAALPDHVLGSHAVAGSSVAATIGSRPSSAAGSEALSSVKPTTFRIYPADESDVDRLITRALVLGDFESAVTLCLSSDRFADAILLAVRGGADLLARTQKAYFERRTTALPYLRLFQSIVSDDLDDVVQNADLAEWQEVFVVLCTFAKADDFAGLVEQLGHRLEFQAGVSTSDSGKALRKHAVLCYLAAGRLEKVVTIWTEEMGEQERAAVASGKAASQAAAHAEALQSLVEKVTVFQSAVSYIDADLAPGADASVRTFKLAPLYDRYREYAELLAGQGLATLALRYISLTPADYLGGGKSIAGDVRSRLSGATGMSASPIASTSKAIPAVRPVPAAAIVPPTAPSQPYAYNASSQPPSAYSAYQAPAAAPSYQPQPAAAPSTDYGYGSPYAPVQPPQAGGPYGPPPQQGGPYGAPPQQQYGQQQYGQPSGQQASMPSSFLPPPPPPLGMSPTPGQQAFSQQGQQPQLAPPPPRQRDQGAWNDAPVVTKRTGSAAGHRPNAIASPFPNMPNAAPAPIASGPQGVAPPPPSRGSTRTPVGGAGPPPPIGRGGPGRFQSPPPASGPPPFSSPPQSFGAPPSQYAPAPQASGPLRQLPPGPPRPGQQYGQGPPPAAPYINGAQSAPPPSPYDLPPGAQQGPPQGPPQGRPGPFPGPPQAQHSFARPAPAPAPAPVPVKPEPSKSKYPAGDRSHLDETARSIYEVLAGKVQRMRAVLPPQQKKMVDDTERRLNVLFDALNCGTISAGTVAQVREITNAIEARNQQLALRLHLELLTSGSKQDDLSGWAPALKLVATRSPEL